jgi:hypothetical protein
MKENAQPEYKAVWDVVALETPLTLITTFCVFAVEIRGPQKGRLNVE